MKKTFLYSTVSVLIAAGSAQAVEVTGGYLNLGYSTFTDTDFGDAYTLNGSGELAFTRAFSTQLDLGVQRFQDLGETSTNWTLHGNWHTQGNASFGAYYGQEDIDEADYEFYGLEAGFDAGPAKIEGYIGRHDLTNLSDADGAMFGISASTDLSNTWELNGGLDVLRDVDGVLDLNLFSIGASYAASDMAEVYGNIGVAHISSDLISDSENEAYVSFGVRVNFGNERGTTFGRRGVLALLPGLPG